LQATGSPLVQAALLAHLMTQDDFDLAMLIVSPGASDLCLGPALEHFRAKRLSGNANDPLAVYVLPLNLDNEQA